jgi:hypothetical protein
VSDLQTSLGEETFNAYRMVVVALQRARVPFLVGGAFALRHHTGIERYSKDFDLFLRRRDLDPARAALERAGCSVEEFSPHWLFKATCNGRTIDLIYRSGNGLAEVDDEWFEYAERGPLFGTEVSYCPAEEMVWSKSFIMERERFDGAEIAHLLHDRGEQLDWDRLVRRFDRNWRVLLSHLVLFGFVYPGRLHMVPTAVIEGLLEKLAAEQREAPLTGPPVCRGTLLSRIQYRVDIDERGYRDGRLPPEGELTRREADRWTRRGAAEEKENRKRDAADGG